MEPDTLNAEDLIAMYEGLLKDLEKCIIACSTPAQEAEEKIDI